jgi:hypothetical protein
MAVAGVVVAYGATGAGPATLPAKTTPDVSKADRMAVVIILHSCEMPDGNYWAEKCVATAVETLLPDDEIGVASYDWERSNMRWNYPLASRGDGKAALAATRSITQGDMPAFGEALKMALDGGQGHAGLSQSMAGRKHVIMLTDGDPQPPSEAVIDQCRKAGVTVSVVCVYPHEATLPAVTKTMADALGGRVYGPINSKAEQQLGDIFGKEIRAARAR